LQIRHVGNNEIIYRHVEACPIMGTINEERPVTGFAYVTLTNDTHQFAIEFSVSTKGSTAVLTRGLLEINGGGARPHDPPAGL
jgi:hypothetical protein